MTIEDPILGNVPFEKSSRCRRISIRVTPSGVKVVMPSRIGMPAALLFFKSNRERVVGMWEKVRLRDSMRKGSEENRDIAGLEGEALAARVEAMRREAREILPPRLAELAARYGFRPTGVCIKHNRSNWGSCSSRGNINLNMNLVRVPEVLRDYLFLHELSHLKHADHGPDFHTLLETLCRDCLAKDHPECLSGGSAFPILTNDSPIHLQLQKRLKAYRLI